MRPSTMLAVAATLLLLTGSAEAQEGNARAEAIARRSPSARTSYDYLVATARTIHDVAVRTFVLDLLANPAPTFMARYPDRASREAVRRALVDAGLLDPSTTVDALFPPLADPHRAPQPFLAAPGGVVDTHHDHPGGLAEHTAFNLKAALALEASYRGHYEIRELNHDLVIAAPILHDAMKPWALQWKTDGTLTEQAKLGGTSSHHAFVLAEAIHRKMPPDLITAIAFAHDPPTEVARVAFVQAGCVLAGVDPEATGLLQRKDGALILASPPSIEANIDHLSDADYTLTDPAAKVVAEALRELHARHFPDETAPGDARWWSIRAKATIPHMKMYAVLRGGGLEALDRALTRAGLFEHAPMRQ